jgi:hypothetical protein
MSAKLLLAFFLLASAGYAQDSLPFVATSESYKKWTKYKPAARAGIAFQKSFSAELGFALHSYYTSDTGFAGRAMYVSAEWAPAFKNYQDNIYAAKLGYELSGGALGIGLEAKYQTDFDDNDMVITPRVGFSAAATISIYYGYNFSTGDYPFGRMTQNQVTVVFNLNRYNYKGLFGNRK